MDFQKSLLGQGTNSVETVGDGTRLPAVDMPADDGDGFANCVGRLDRVAVGLVDGDVDIWVVHTMLLSFQTVGVIVGAEQVVEVFSVGEEVGPFDGRVDVVAVKLDLTNAVQFIGEQKRETTELFDSEINGQGVNFGASERVFAEGGFGRKDVAVGDHRVVQCGQNIVDGGGFDKEAFMAGVVGLQVANFCQAVEQ